MQETQKNIGLVQSSELENLYCSMQSKLGETSFL